jgi:YD repeat-containing protein
MMHLNDGLGRLLEVQETGAGQTWRTRFRHDLSDNVVQTVDSQSNEKCIRYDGLGRRIFLNDPDRGLLYLRYDDASNLILSTDAKGQEIAYTHDGANRWLTEEYVFV